MTTVTNIAALRSFNTSGVGEIDVQGYYASGDGGGGAFVFVSTSSPPSDNGGTIISAAAPLAGYWQRHIDGAYNIKWFGAKGDLSQDDQPSIQACVTAAGSSKIYAPVGQYKLNSTVTSTLPINVFGAGNGAGPGPAAQDNANCTQFLAYFGNADVFSVTSIYPSTFRDFQINVAVANRPATGGAGIALYATSGATQANSKVENVAFQNTFNCIFMKSPAWPTIHGCFFTSWINYAIYSVTVSGIEGSAGFITGNFFFGDTRSTATQAGCIYLENGYVEILGNEILGGICGIRINIANFNAGYIRIIANTIEEQRSNSIYADSADGSTMAFLGIFENEFSVIGNAGVFGQHIVVADYNSGTTWNYLTQISNNTYQSNLSGTGQKFIWILSGTNVQINNETIRNFGSSTAIGVQVTGVTTNAGLIAPISIKDIQFTGSIAAFALANTGVCLLDHMQGVTYSTLASWGSVANGSRVYVTDGQATSSTNPLLTGAGTLGGVTANFMRGHWYAPYGLTG